MTWSRTLATRLRTLFRKAELERELDDELHFHLEMQTEQNIRDGMTPAEARRQAVLLFGGVEGHREALRDAWSVRLLEEVAADMRYAVRALRRSPGFTVVAIVTLALGIGANTALFSLMSGLLWTPPAGVEDSKGLSWVTHVEAGRPLGLSYPDYVAFRDESGVFAELAAFTAADVAVGSEGGEPERRRAEVVTGSYFSVLRMRPALGRGFVAEEDRTPGTHPVAVLSYDLWLNRFGGRSDVVGRRITVNGAPFTVVGVAPVGFRGLDDIEEPSDLWLPVMMHATAMPSWKALLDVDSGIRTFTAVGRLKPGLSREQALAPLGTLTRRAAAAEPEAYQRVTPGLYPFRGIAGPGGGGNAVEILLLCAGVTLVVLLIACGNVANLLLARAAARSREIAIRSAIGASRLRVVRQLVAESLVLALGGGVAGVILAVWMIRLFLRLASIPFPVPVALDERALLATLVLSLATGLVFGVAPALRASRADLTVPLKGSGDGGRGGARPQRALVAGQLALSLVLLVTATLLMSRLRESMSASATFASGEKVLTLAVDLRVQGYSPEGIRAFEQELLERAASVPGVESATLTGRLPEETRMCEWRVAVDGRAWTRANVEDWCVVTTHEVWPAFFATLERPILRGRDFSLEDRSGAEEVAIVNETAARTFWPAGDALGGRIRLGPDSLSSATVVGVVPDAEHERRPGRVLPAVYRPKQQKESVWPTTTLLVRTQGDALELAGPLRAEIRAIDPELPVFDVRTMAAVVSMDWLPTRIGSTLLLLFGALALLLAVVGLHGVVAFTVVQRTREVGIRMALGASRREILTLFTRDTARVAGTGVAIGVLLSAACWKILSAMVQGIRPADAVTVGGLIALLLCAALLATLLPARRATRVDPMVALRAE